MSMELSIQQVLSSHAETKAGYLMQLDRISDCIKASNAEDLEQRMLKVIRKKLVRRTERADLYHQYRTPDGYLMQAFMRLTEKYGASLKAELAKIAVPLDVYQIARNKNTYKRFARFYQDAFGVGG